MALRRVGDNKLRFGRKDEGERANQDPAQTARTPLFADHMADRVVLAGHFLRIALVFLLSLVTLDDNGFGGHGALLLGWFLMPYGAM